MDAATSRGSAGNECIPASGLFQGGKPASIGHYLPQKGKPSVRHAEGAGNRSSRESAKIQPRVSVFPATTKFAAGEQFPLILHKQIVARSISIQIPGKELLQRASSSASPSWSVTGCRRPTSKGIAIILSIGAAGSQKRNGNLSRKSARLSSRTGCRLSRSVCDRSRQFFAAAFSRRRSPSSAPGRRAAAGSRHRGGRW